MKTLNIAVILLIISPFIALSQSNYKPGYVIKNSGDTLKGYINYKEWNESPKTIEFKQVTTDARSVSYNAPDIKSFRVNGLDSYISYVGPVTTGKTHTIEGLPNFLDTAVRQDEVFLRVISSGPNVKLLYNIDREKYRYFILETNSTPYELKFYQYLDNNQRIISSSPFIDQIDLLLKKYASTNINATGRVNVEDYSEDAITRYVKIINNNKSVEEARSSGHRFFIGAGVNYSLGTFNGPDGFNYQPHASSVFPLISLGVDLLTNPAIQKSFFRIQVSLSGASPTFNSSVGYFSSREYLANLVGQYIINLYNTEKLKYFIGFGAAFTNTFVTNSKFVATTGGVVVSPLSIQPLGNSYPALKIGDSFQNPYDFGKGGLDILFKTGVVLNKKIELSLDIAPFSLGFSTNAGSASSSTGYARTGLYSYKSMTTAIGFNYLFGSTKTN